MGRQGPRDLARRSFASRAGAKRPLASGDAAGGEAVPFEDDGPEFNVGKGRSRSHEHPKTPAALLSDRAVVDAVKTGGPDVPGVGPGGCVGDGVVEGSVTLADIGEGAIDCEDQVPENPPCPWRCADGGGTEPGVVVKDLSETGIQVMPEVEDARPLGFGKASARPSIGRYPGGSSDKGTKPPGNSCLLKGSQDAGFRTMEPVPRGFDLDYGKPCHQTLTQAWR